MEYDVHGDAILPVHNRTPTSPGFVLTWKERASTSCGLSARTRQGMVLCTGPWGQSVWVVPDNRLPGEGYAVLVREVTRADAAHAMRVVGGAGDYVSREDWQSPRRLLPRAVLRTDRLGGAECSLVHSAGDCPAPYTMGSGPVVRGVPEPLDECYVFTAVLHPERAPTVGGDPELGRWLHPWSRTPLDPSGHSMRPCGQCLRPGAPV